mmetsp:Transcript_64522/g.88637  ORF Transcript_64522/g.88637 Transcript_64522/m.88637 type:complete len:240 (+) Transcript_64522:214-933(+)
MVKPSSLQTLGLVLIAASQYTVRKIQQVNNIFHSKKHGRKCVRWGSSVENGLYGEIVRSEYPKSLPTPTLYMHGSAGSAGPTGLAVQTLLFHVQLPKAQQRSEAEKILIPWLQGCVPSVFNSTVKLTVKKISLSKSTMVRQSGLISLSGAVPRKSLLWERKENRTLVENWAVSPTISPRMLNQQRAPVFWEICLVASRHTTQLAKPIILYIPLKQRICLCHASLPRVLNRLPKLLQECR